MQADRFAGDEPARFEPPGDLAVGETQAAVRMFGAQIFEPVRGEVHHHHATAWLEDAPPLGDGPGRIAGKVQHLMKRNHAERGLGQRQGVHVGVAHLAIAQAKPIEIGARDRKHLVRQVDTDAALDMPPEDLENASAAGANIEKITNFAVGEEIEQDLLNVGFGHVQRADFVPACGVGPEIGGRRGNPRLP